MLLAPVLGWPTGCHASLESGLPQWSLVPGPEISLPPAPRPSTPPLPRDNGTLVLKFWKGLEYFTTRFCLPFHMLQLQFLLVANV